MKKKMVGNYSTCFVKGSNILYLTCERHVWLQNLILCNISIVFVLKWNIHVRSINEKVWNAYWQTHINHSLIYNTVLCGFPSASYMNQTVIYNFLSFWWHPLRLYLVCIANRLLHDIQYPYAILPGLESMTFPITYLSCMINLG